ncbi:MAG: hypothetical protein J5792_00660 [Bacteroidales bacterium]|nr:hypothetical protein [Bacteroidales bacterium]
MRGHYLRAGRYVIEAQRDSYKLFDEHKGREEKAFLRQRKVKVTEVRTTQRSDTTAVASCNLIIRTAEKTDTICKNVLLKKEKGRWRICNGILFDK